MKKKTQHLPEEKKPAPENYLQKIINASVQKPEEFYAKNSDEKGFKPTIIHYLLCILAATPIALLVNYQAIASGVGGTTLLPGYAIFAGALVATALNVVLGLAGACVYVGLFHAVSYALGAREGILRTAQSYAYGMTASLIISPYISGVSSYFELVSVQTALGFMLFLAGLAVLIWGFYRVYHGVVGLQKLSFWKAIIATILPVVILFALYALLMGLAPVA